MPEPKKSNDDPKPEDQIDFSKLSSDQLAKVLENPELFKQPRIKELLEAQKQLKKLQEEQAKKTDDDLVEQKKWEDLANKRGEEIDTLRGQIKDLNTNQAITQALSKEKVVDLDAALKLVDKGKLTFKDDGTIEGIDDAVKALQTDRSYLFTPGSTKPVGAPSNPTGDQNPSGPAKFKRSQLSDSAFYKEHEKEILEAANNGLIEDDITPGGQPGPQQQ